MNESLEIALKDHFNKIKKGRANYNSCYKSFLDYCSRFENDSLKELFEKITLFEVKEACKQYVENSKKASSFESIQRFLSAMDLLNIEINKYGIQCNALKGGCRNKEFVREISSCINKELKKSVYLPFDRTEDLKKVNSLINKLDLSKYYQLGQVIIYKMLLKYGFKEQVISNLKLQDYANGILYISNNDKYSVQLQLDCEIKKYLDEYCKIHKFKEREYFFTKLNGKKLSENSIFATLKPLVIKESISNFSPTSVALQGISNLISKGLSLSEIKILTGFEMQKIEDVSEYMMLDYDVSKSINNKINNSNM